MSKGIFFGEASEDKRPASASVEILKRLLSLVVKMVLKCA
jgi:hypothetical protein